MTRGDCYRVSHPAGGDPKKSRVFVVVSRQALIDSRFSTVICAPVYSAYHGLATQVSVGIAEGLKHASSIHCDALMSLPKSALTDFVGSLSSEKLQAAQSGVAYRLRASRGVPGSTLILTLSALPQDTLRANGEGKEVSLRGTQ
ncbi:type II toxin-antitoxin system PemK/MazF family toxin [candidate division KSB3 bacterium]|uniref:Type II toxin-antitoxin system PemK/MazF family toxin n=1 Tax=candidate division KSB3 bacterium TaxID=2044937 RepID=A0A9D5JUH0_9BACT|nr:type II toxin-antitoxin system PemK/MazF family toxin [candidate division KSB3 bacterium]MBD3324142.1 type II toxin-antitoxin system PemK/MazF family toxin [candidate division KSB3 bacterium]